MYEFFSDVDEREKQRGDIFIVQTKIVSHERGGLGELSIVKINSGRRLENARERTRRPRCWMDKEWQDNVTLKCCFRTHCNNGSVEQAGSRDWR